MALHDRPDIHICRECIGSLRERSGLLDVTPILPTVDVGAAVAFYEAAGFETHAYEGGGFAFVQFAGASVFDLGFAEDLDPAANRTGCFIIVPDADEWHARLAALGYDVSDVLTAPWGMREFSLTDPSGNHLRFGHGVEG